jgi:uncharacterized protein (DUF952 family)
MSATTDYLTFHLVPGEYLRALDRSVAYTPADFERDGFIHCTDGAEAVAATANRYYREDRRMYVALVIDTRRLRATVRYEDDARIYPHIYGALDWSSVVAVVPMLRAADGSFLPPELRGLSETV